MIEAGGLYIIGTERHESRRIDNQLRGRLGRQGDPGASRFYLSLEDNLMRIFGGERMQKIMNTLRIPDDEAITDRMVSRAIAGAQRKVESHNFSVRKHLLDYDDVMNQQRMAIYLLRRRVLKGDDLERIILDFLSEITSHLLDNFVNEDVKKEMWELESFSQALAKSFNLDIQISLDETPTAEEITQKVQKQVKENYDQKKQDLGSHFKSLVQFILLQTIDVRWKEHLENIDFVKESVGLRGYAQKDPLVEYKKKLLIFLSKSIFKWLKSALKNYSKYKFPKSLRIMIYLPSIMKRIYNTKIQILKWTGIRFELRKKNKPLLLLKNHL